MLCLQNTVMYEKFDLNVSAQRRFTIRKIDINQNKNLHFNLKSAGKFNRSIHTCMKD